MDGFWKLRVKEPFAKRDKAALDLVHTLLRTLFIRHSKKQIVRVTGRNILELPSLTHTIKRCPLDPVERSILGFIESLGVDAASHYSIFEDMSTGEAQIPSWMGQLLRPARVASWAPALLLDGDLLKKIDRFIRGMRTVAVPVISVAEGEIAVVSPKVAIDIMHQALSAKAADGFVNEQSKRNQWESNRRKNTNNIEDDLRELNEVDSRITRLQGIIDKTGAIPKLRWRWAILSVVRAAFLRADNVMTAEESENLAEFHAHIVDTSPGIARRLAQRTEIEVSSWSAFEVRNTWLSMCACRRMKVAFAKRGRPLRQPKSRQRSWTKSSITRKLFANVICGRAIVKRKHTCFLTSLYLSPSKILVNFQICQGPSHE